MSQSQPPPSTDTGKSGGAADLLDLLGDLTMDAPPAPTNTGGLSIPVILFVRLMQ